MAEAKRLTEAAAQAQTDAAQRIRTAVRGLLAAGLGVSVRTLPPPANELDD